MYTEHRKLLTVENFEDFDELYKQFVKIFTPQTKDVFMHAIVKILPINYILKDNLSKFSIANNLLYMVLCTGKFSSF